MANSPTPQNFRKTYPNPKLKNNWGPCSSTFHVEQPETLIEWKFKSITDQLTDGLTWVGARDTCVSKKQNGFASRDFHWCVATNIITEPTNRPQ